MKANNLCSLAAFVGMELMDKEAAPNCRDMTAADVRALAAKFARWARQCRKTAAAMEAEKSEWVFESSQRFDLN